MAQEYKNIYVLHLIKWMHTLMSSPVGSKAIYTCSYMDQLGNCYNIDQLFLMVNVKFIP